MEGLSVNTIFLRKSDYYLILFITVNKLHVGSKSIMRMSIYLRHRHYYNVSNHLTMSSILIIPAKNIQDCIGLLNLAIGSLKTHIKTLTAL